jgi:hypothetical protein
VLLGELTAKMRFSTTVYFYRIRALTVTLSKKTKYFKKLKTNGTTGHTNPRVREKGQIATKR